MAWYDAQGYYHDDQVAQNPTTPQWDGGYMAAGGDSGTSWVNPDIRGSQGELKTDMLGNTYQYNFGADNPNGNWSYMSPDALKQNQQTIAGGADQSYNWDKYSNNVSGIPTLEAGAFDNWQANPYLNTAVNTGGAGAIYKGLQALLAGGQDLGSITGVMGDLSGSYNADNNKLSDATYRQLAKYMGLDANASDFREQVANEANKYAMVKGMTGLDPNNARAATQTLFRQGDSGEWNPVLNYNWSNPEKGSWWEEGGNMIMVPLSIVAGGALSTLGSGAAAGGTSGAAGAGGGITGTAGASGVSAYGGAGLGSTLGTAGTGSLGAGLGTAAGSSIGAGTGVATGLGGQLANYLGYGSEYANLPGYAQNAISGALQGGANSALQGQNPLEGALTGGLMGGLSPAMNSAIGDLGLGSTATGALQGAAGGGLKNLLTGGNPLTGAVLGGVGGGVGGGISAAGGSNGLASLGSKYASQLTGSYIQNQIKDEVLQGRQDLLNDMYAEADRRGISRQQLNQFLQTAQGRQAAQALLAGQSKGTLQSLFG